MSLPIAPYVDQEEQQIRDIREREHKETIYDHMRLFRAGETHDGQHSITPRMVAFGLKGSVGESPHMGMMYRKRKERDILHAQAKTHWKAGVSVHVVESDPPSSFVQDEQGFDPYYDVEEQSGIQTWTDYLKCPLHPRSWFELPLQHGVDPFDMHVHGLALFRSMEQRDAALDAVRFFAEECDGLQGFQCILDSDSGGGGVAAALLPLLRDDYPRTPIVGLGCVEQSVTLDHALTMATFSDPMLNAMLVPASGTVQWPDHIAPRKGSRYCSSAVMASAWDTVVHPLRLQRTRQRLVDIMSASTGGHRMRTAALEMQWPCTEPDVKGMWLTPGYQPTGRVPTASWTVVRGLDLKSMDERTQMEWWGRVGQGGRRWGALASAPLPIPLTFPQMFRASLDDKGMPTTGKEEGMHRHVRSIPVGARLVVDRSVGALVGDLERVVQDVRRSFGVVGRRSRASMLTQYLAELDWTVDEVDDVLNQLSSARADYEKIE